MKNYGMNQIIDAANDIAQETPNNKVVVIDLDEAQTAWRPGSDKYAYQGPGRVKYVIRPDQALSYPMDDSVGIVPA